MKICVLASEYEQSTLLKSVDSARDPSTYDKFNLHSFELVYIKKITAVKQVADLARTKKYDVYLNLCEACWYDDTAGFEVVDALHKLNLPYTGASPIFYQVSKQAMKMIAYSCGISIPNHIFAYSQSDIEEAFAMNLAIPVIVKHYNGHDSVGMTKESKVTTKQQLSTQALKLINEYRGALIEEFIEGPEYTVLVVANPDNPEDPIALTPAECKFPEGETFKHFDLKWNNFNSLRWMPVTDEKLSRQLKDASKKIFVASNGSSYARCDYRIRSSTGELFFLEINANCGIFYTEGNWASADEILSFDPLGHHGFLELIIQSALLDQKSRRRVTRPSFKPDKGFYLQATEDIRVGDLIQRNEEIPTALVSLQHTKSVWGVVKQDWLRKYSFPFSKNVFGTWAPDPNDWEPINHSCDPNAWLTGLNVTARKDIAVGQEVTIDYGTFGISDFTDQFECHCQSNNCRKIIRPPLDYKDKSFQEQYEGHVSDYVREKIESL